MCRVRWRDCGERERRVVEGSYIFVEGGSVSEERVSSMDKISVQSSQPDIRLYASRSLTPNKKLVCRCCTKKFTSQSFVLHSEHKVNNKTAIFIKKENFKKVYQLLSVY